MTELSEILRDLAKQNHSDIHFRSQEKIWGRLNGILSPKSKSTFTHQNLKSLLTPIIPVFLSSSFNQNHEIDFSYELDGAFRFRVNIYYDINGIAACFRILPKRIFNVNELNMEPAIIELCNKKKGLILITGPTGSGKSTTLASLLDFINLKRKNHIITIEDPIEYKFSNNNCLINQRELGRHVSSFHKSIRASLREDPDVLMIGEMRDLETTSSALEIAETGHLVFSTLHTNSAASTIYRIINQYPKKKQNQIRMFLASTLLCVVTQLLIPTKDKKSRVAIKEIMIMNHAIANLIRENKIHQIENMIKLNQKSGMISMLDAITNAVENNIISSIDAIEYSPDPAKMEQILYDKGFF